MYATDEITIVENGRGRNVTKKYAGIRARRRRGFCHAHGFMLL
jgi:hypothetical protein